MNTYYLYRCPRTNRVILDGAMPEKVSAIRTIEAKDWGAARDAVGDFEFNHVPGHGWF